MGTNLRQLALIVTLISPLAIGNASAANEARRDSNSNECRGPQLLGTEGGVDGCASAVEWRFQSRHVGYRRESGRTRVRCRVHGIFGD